MQCFVPSGLTGFGQSGLRQQIILKGVGNLIYITAKPNPPTPFPAREGGEMLIFPLSSQERGAGGRGQAFPGKIL